MSISQTGIVGTPLSAPVSVRVTDASGDAVGDVAVMWAPAAGSVSASTSLTNADGVAEIRWTLGTVAGAQRLSASLDGAPDVSPVELQATAIAGPTTGLVITPQTITLQPRGSASFTAEVGPDQYGNPVTTEVVWSTSDDVSSPITADGIVRAGRAGHSVITAAIGSVTARASVEVSVQWTAIGAGGSHSCALDALGYAFCWGDNSVGQLGVSGIEYDSVPTPVSGARRYDSLAVGQDHACGLTSDHAAYCWGSNSSGQLGIGTLQSSRVYTPTRVVGGYSFASLTSTGVHTCGLTTEGDAYCWGWESAGELGNGKSGTFDSQPAPVAVLGGLRFSVMAGGTSHTCAITSAGEPYCWGNDFEGQVGDNNSSEGYRSTPVAVSGGLTATSIIAGGSYSCAIDEAGQTWCWGTNEMGEVGDGSFQTRLAPVAISPPSPFVRLAPGYRHACALDSAGRAYCWGFNATGQLGEGTTLRKGSPTPVATDARFTTISGGGGHTCALTAEGSAYCWGDNHIGQLGIGAFAMQMTPVRIAAP
ncbi:MAG TPA: hypothetical protein VIQ74_01380 [Gemmatimonadaceae bacterium]